MLVVSESLKVSADIAETMWWIKILERIPTGFQSPSYRWRRSPCASMCVTSLLRERVSANTETTDSDPVIWSCIFCIKIPIPRLLTLNQIVICNQALKV